MEASKSIIIEVEKSHSIELGFADIQTLAIKDPKELTDGVGITAVIGGVSGGISTGVGVVNPPKSLQPSESKLKNATLAGVTTASISATGRIIFNFLTHKSPTIVYNADNEDLRESAIINLLPPGTKVRIIQKNHINNNVP